MNKKFLAELPTWYKSEKDFSLVLSDDIDSLITCALLTFVKDWHIGYYYDFQSTWKVEGETNNNRVWCDVALMRDEMSFDNHVSRLNMDSYYNKEMINPNLLADITAQNYKDKYAGSTALLVWSVYNLPLPQSEEGKMILLCLDAMFRGYYRGFKEQQRRYLCDMFEYPELYELYKRHKSEDFSELMDKYNIDAKVKVGKNGKLHTDADLKGISKLLGIDIKLPDSHFLLKHDDFYVKKIDITSEQIKKSNKIISLAFTFSRRAVCTVKGVKEC